MNRRADTLDKARILIEEHVKTNFDQLYGMGNGALAHNCIVNDLGIQQNPVLIELAMTVWENMVVRHRQNLAKDWGKHPQEMNKAEMIDTINKLKLEVDLLKQLNEKIEKDGQNLQEGAKAAISEAQTVIGSLLQENARLNVVKMGFITRVLTRVFFGKKAVELADKHTVDPKKETNHFHGTVGQINQDKRLSDEKTKI